MDDEWVPLSIRQKGERTDEILFDGIPAWLGPSLWHWLENWLLNCGPGDMRQDLQELERMLHRDLDSGSLTGEEERFWPGLANTGKTPPPISRLRKIIDADDDLFLDFLDQQLHKMSVLPKRQYDAIVGNPYALRSLCSHWQRIEALQKALVEGGSIWAVLWPFPEPGCLAHRVTVVTQEQVERVAQGQGRPGDYLLKAWREVFGRHPDPGSGYRDAVRAVEAAAKPVVTPKDENATLGTIIPALEQGWKKFVVVLGDAQQGQQDRVAVVSA